MTEPLDPTATTAVRVALRRRRRAVLGLLIAATFAGCEREDATASGRLTPEAFADVIVELREAERDALETDSAMEVFARRKAEILERHRTSEEEIRAFVADPRHDVRMLADVWEEISNRLRRPVPEDTL
ncbi:MAG TPA: hypothetical protein VMM12_13780 [Longimicrobiales bacterium]|nr:hypothetical protein [Longimicrobiales bacterium]